MKTTNRLISLFAALLTTATLMADKPNFVKYEPLIVDSGFNRDVIAETTDIANCAWSPLYDLSGSSKHKSCFGTDSTIAKINKTKGYKQVDYEKTIRCGWPSDFGNQNDRIVRCTSDGDAIDSALFSQIEWLLAPYDGLNALCIRPNDPTKSGQNFQRKGTLRFKKIGCYDRLFFLMVSLREGGTAHRHVQTTVYYTEGDTTYRDFDFENGLGGMEGRRVRLTNIYEDGIFKKNVPSPGDGKDAFASVFDITLDQGRLVDSIVFENPVINSGAIILAITGRTADIAAPIEETSQISNINEHSFKACWDAVTNAVSYRLDVASDSAFQHILTAYNNKEINDGLCAEVKNLVEDSAYYWRIRSVNEAGGQSASSAPKRVKTAGGTVPETAETNENIEEDLEQHINKLYSTFRIDRTLWRDGYYNTLCLPFDMTPGEIAVSPLVGATVYKYVSAEKIGNCQLDIEVEDTTGIKAGVPYLIQWPNMGDIIPAPLEFHNVTIKTNTGRTIGGENDIKFVGNIGIATLVEEDENNLFLGANNTLYWPNPDQNRMKGFRAHFRIPVDGPNAVPKNTPSRIVTRSETTTDIMDITPVIHESSKAYKVLINNNLYIIQNSVMYNLQGQLVK